MSKFDHERMIEECAEYQEYLEAQEAGLDASKYYTMEQMAEYFYDQANLELLGLHNG